MAGETARGSGGFGFDPEQPDRAIGSRCRFATFATVIHPLVQATTFSESRFPLFGITLWPLTGGRSCGSSHRLQRERGAAVDRNTVCDKGRIFRELHAAPGAFVVPNPWDIGTAKLLAALRVQGWRRRAPALHSRGLPDGGVGFEATIAHCREMVAATPTAGLGRSRERQGRRRSRRAPAETIFAAEAAGLAGCSIEDHTGNPRDPIYDFDLAVERVTAAAEAAMPLDQRHFVFTARAENFLWGRKRSRRHDRPSPGLRTGRRRRLYAPGLPDIETVRTVCSSVSKPVNVLARPQFNVAALSRPVRGASRSVLARRLRLWHAAERRTGVSSTTAPSPYQGGDAVRRPAGALPSQRAIGRPFRATLMP